MTRRMASVLLWVLALLTLSPFTLGGVAATAAPDQPLRGALTGLTADDDSVGGVLTLGTKQPITGNDVTATIDGTEVPIELSDEVRAQRTVMLVIDTSGSMGISGMATVRAAVREYLAQAPPDVSVGVVSFAATSGVDLAPTTDRGQVEQVVASLVARGDTDLFGGVDAAVDALADREGDRSIVLLSDGADTIATDPARAQRKAVELVGDEQLRLDVVRFNTDDPRAVGALADLSAAGSGSVSAANDPAAVTAAFSAAAAALESQIAFTLAPVELTPGSHRLVLTGRAGDQPFRAETDLDGDAVPTTATGSGADTDDAAPAPTSQTQRLVPAEQSLLLPILAAVGVGLGLFGLCFLLLSPDLRSKRERRMEALTGYLPAAAGGERRRTERKDKVTPLANLMAFSDRVANRRKSVSRTLELLHRADLPFTPGEWLVIRLLSVVVPLLLAWLLGAHWLLYPLILALGLIVPAVALRFLAKRRANKFEAQLPGVLMLLATSLSSGFGLPQAFDGVVQDAGDPLAKEFSRAQAETRIGAELVDALERVADRMDSTTLRWTIMAMRIQADVGGNLAETLKTTASTLRDREALHGQVRALSAEGRLSAYILIALPIGIFFYMMMVNFDYISLLWTNLVGIAMLAAGLVALGIGIVWMRKVVEIEV